MELLKETVEYSNIPIWEKDRIIREYVHLEYGTFDFQVRFSKSNKEYYDNTVLMVKVAENKYEYMKHNGNQKI